MHPFFKIVRVISVIKTTQHLQWQLSCLRDQMDDQRSVLRRPSIVATVNIGADEVFSSRKSPSWVNIRHSVT